MPQWQLSISGCEKLVFSIEIQHFAIQEWRAKKEIFIRHIIGIIDHRDDLTKAVGWILHSRHAHRGMGHYQIGSPKDSESPVCSPMLQQGPSESERVLEPICDHLDCG